jgi:hypothetical protein
MTTTLDQAVAAAQAAEATYNSDVTNVTNIQTAITTTTAPLVPAQAQLATDQAAFVTALQAVSDAALAEISALSQPTSPSGN